MQWTVAVRVALSASALFLIAGLLTGVWKYLAIWRSEEARAPVYVDIAHRAALMYSFACLVMAQLAGISEHSPAVTLAATIAPICFFAAAVLLYVVHGALRDTDNQLAQPHRLGSAQLPRGLVAAGMWLLIAAEVGGVAILSAGALSAMW